MASKAKPVLEEDDLNAADRDILRVLQTGRATPRYIAEEKHRDRSYMNQRLKRLVEHDHVEKLAPGLYELADDPRADDSAAADEADLRARLQDALEARDDAQAKADRLEADLDDCREQLAAAREDSVDADAVARALDDLEAACERGDGDAVQDAIRRAREAIGDA